MLLWLLSVVSVVFLVLVESILVFLRKRLGLSLVGRLGLGASVVVLPTVRGGTVQSRTGAVRRPHRRRSTPRDPVVIQVNLIVNGAEVKRRTVKDALYTFATISLL